MTALQIDADWEAGAGGLAEDRETAALLRIRVGESSATRVTSEWSGSVHDWVRVSAYPLATWFASSWWRLRWETMPLGQLSASWLTSHTTAAAGHGFIWPNLIFDSDGEDIRIRSVPTRVNSIEPIRYLSHFSTVVSAEDFERSVDAFIGRVLARLEVRGLTHTPLNRLWSEIVNERADQTLARWRRLEAKLGFDPDEAPEAAVERLIALVGTTGADAIEEIAPILGQREPEAALSTVEILAAQPGIEARVEISLLEETLVPISNGQTQLGFDLEPWSAGRLLARRIRNILGNNNNPMSNSDLASLLQIAPVSLAGSEVGQFNVPLGLGVRGDDSNSLKLIFRRRNRVGRRFEAARFVADYAFASPEDRWLPLTDMKTARQKTQRAFAAELLCPIKALTDFLGDDYSDEATEHAGEHFDVSPLAVRSQLANNGLIAPEAVAV